jgi:hypothetical protein
VNLSLNRLGSYSAQYRIAGVDPEKAVVDEVYDFKPATSVAKDDGKKWTVREVDDTEAPDVMLLSSWKKALVPFLGLTTPLPMIFALWYTYTQLRIFSRHAESLWSKDRNMFIGLPLVVLDLLLVRKSTYQGISNYRSSS